MKKQFQQIKNFVQDIKDINLNTRDNKNETLSTDLKKAEKKLDLIKQVCQSTEKKITACLQLLPSGHLNNNSFTERNLNLNNINAMNSSLMNKSISSNTEDQLMDTLLLEKKQKKVPEVQLHQTLQEMGDLFDNDSILGITLIESGEIQKQLSKELLRYEQDVERLCLSPLNDIMENDIPAVLKSRKQLNKASTEVDNLKLKLNQAIKHNQQNGQQVKIDSLTKELQDSSNRLIQIKNNFVMELYHFLGREAEFACIYVQLFKLRANYHKNVVDIIEQNMPRLENIILSTNQKPVFGTSLCEYAEQTNRDLSIVVEYCICILNDNLNEEGLFRVPGSTSKVKKLKTFFNMQTYQQIQEYNENQLNGVKDGSFYSANLDNYDEFITDPHSVAGCLKSFFRELPEPLFVFAIYDDLVKCASISNINDRLTALWKIINSMPKPHIENLRYLIKFFAKLAVNQEINKMTPQNLSIAVAPSLIWAPPSTSQTDTGNNSPTGINQMTYGLDMCSANQYGIIIETLILYSDWFFKGDIEFDSLKRNCSRKSSTENILKSPQPTTPTNRTPTNQSQQNSPKSTSKSFSAQFTNNQPFSGSQFMNNQFLNNKDRNPLPTPRMSTRSKKAPAPQIPPISKALNQSNGKNNGLNISSQNLNDTSNFVTNSPFILQGDSKSSSSQSNDLPTLKSFERKGSFQNDYCQQSSTPLSMNKKRLNNCKDDGNSSSSGTGSTSSNDSVNSLNSNTIIEKQQKQNDKINFNNNSSNDSLLSNTEPSNYQNAEQLSSSSSENLDAKEIKSQKILSTFTPRQSAIINKTPDSSPFNATYGSLDRCQLRQLPAERSRQMGQHRTSSSFVNPQTRSISKGRAERPTSIPPPIPSKFQKPRSHDDLLMDSNDLKNEDEKELKNKNINKLKLDVKCVSYNVTNDQDELDNVSYVKLDGNESVKFTNQSNEQLDDEKVNFNNNILDDSQFKLPPEKPKRCSPPPRPNLPSAQIFKSSKSLMNEHTYL